MQISSSRTRITPEGPFFPCYLLGHAIRTEKATGRRGRSLATALVLKIEETTLIWVTVDLAGFSKTASDHLRAELSHQYSVAKEAITISFTHTHSGPEYDSVSPFFGTEKAGIPGYMEFVQSQILKAVAQCFEKGFEEVQAYASTLQIEGCYGNRNGKDKPADKNLTTIEFRSGERIVGGHSQLHLPSDGVRTAELFCQRRSGRQSGAFSAAALGRVSFSDAGRGRRYVQPVIPSG